MKPVSVLPLARVTPLPAALVMVGSVPAAASVVPDDDEGGACAVQRLVVQQGDAAGVGAGPGVEEDDVAGRVRSGRAGHVGERVERAVRGAAAAGAAVLSTYQTSGATTWIVTVAVSVWLAGVSGSLSLTV